MGCLTAEELDSLASGELPPDAAGRLRKHAADCPECRERLSTQESDEDLLRQLKRLPSEWFDTRATAEVSVQPGSSAPADGRSSWTPGELLPDGFAGYQVIERIHQGGQGLVYRALQIGTGREVAIKVLREGPFAHPDDRVRFEREIRLLASIRHPHIVTVHDSGVVGGNCYFVMDYVDGDRLDAYTARIGRPIRHIVELFARICEAVNAAHLQGIIHRDLKPGNVLVDRDAQPRILDFGLAKEASVHVSDTLDAQSMTATGQFLGSLPWSSPEQAEGHPMQADTRTDVYSLGVMFYHALTAHFPYDVNGHLRDVLERIIQASPDPPRSRRGEIDDELQTILLKCLSKEPHRRYQTAGELAQDLRRYLAGEPIHAKNDSPLYLFRKMLRRYWVPVIVAASFAILVMASTVALAFLYRSARSSAAIADQQRSAALHAQNLARHSEHAAITEKQNAERIWYRALISLADRDIAENFYRPASQFLEACAPVCRNWEWGWLQHLLHLEQRHVPAHEGAVRSVDYSPDGALFATAGADSAVKLWDAATGRLLRMLSGHAMPVHGAYFSPDGALLATCGDDHYVGVWNAQSGERLGWFEASLTDAVTAIAFDPRGERLATGSGSHWGNHVHDYSVRIWDVRTLRERAAFHDFHAAVYCVAFSPDGGWLAAGSADGTIRIFDLATGTFFMLEEASSSAVLSLAFSPGGQWLAASNGRGHTHGNEPDNRVRVWKWREQELLCALEHGVSTSESSVQSVRFAPDGSRLITAGADRTARMWELPSGREIARYQGHEADVTSAQFSPSGEMLITASSDHSVKLWTASPPDPFVTLQHEASVQAVAFSPDSGRLAAALSSGRLVLWDAGSAEPISERQAHASTISSLKFSPDGSRLLTSGQDQTIRVFNAFTLEELVIIPATACQYSAWAVFTPDGARLAVGTDRNDVRILDAHSGEEIRSLVPPGMDPGCPKCTWCIEHAHGGSMLAVAIGHGIELWNADAGVLFGVMPAPDSTTITRVAFSPDDRLLAGTGQGGFCKLWDAQTRRQVLSLETPIRVVRTLAFSPDGSRLILGGEDGAVRIHETSTGIELLNLTWPSAPVRCVTFSPDGQTMALADATGRVLLWRASPW